MAHKLPDQCLSSKKTRINMTRKFVLPLVLFVIGLLIALATRDNLEGLIKGLFVNLTDQKIRFHDFSIRIVAFAPPYYYAAWAVCFVGFCYSKYEMNRALVLRFVIIEVVLFFLALVGVSYLAANLLLAATTDMDYKIWSDDQIQFGLIILLSMATGMIPSLVYQWVRRNRRKHEAMPI
jgi:hypothetical protein